MQDLILTDQPEQCPGCGGDQLRLNGTHVAELDADFNGEDRIDYDFDNWHGWIGDIDCRCSDCDHEWTVPARPTPHSVLIDRDVLRGARDLLLTYGHVVRSLDEGGAAVEWWANDGNEKDGSDSYLTSDLWDLLNDLLKGAGVKRSPLRTITIHILGGNAYSVTGLPEGWDYEKCDRDMCSLCGGLDPKCECGGPE